MLVVAEPLGFPRGTEAHVAPQDLYAGDGIRELVRPIASHDHAAAFELAVILPPAPTRRITLPVHDVVTGAFIRGTASPPTRRSMAAAVGSMAARSIKPISGST